jgi:hypothetical protein
MVPESLPQVVNKSLYIPKETEPYNNMAEISEDPLPTQQYEEVEAPKESFIPEDKVSNIFLKNKNIIKEDIIPHDHILLNTDNVNPGIPSSINQLSDNVKAFTIFDLANVINNKLNSATLRTKLSLSSEIILLLKDNYNNVIKEEQIARPSESVMVYTINNFANDIYNAIDKTILRDRLATENELLELLTENRLNLISEEQFEETATRYRLKKLFTDFVSKIKSLINAKRIEEDLNDRADRFKNATNDKLKANVFRVIKKHDIESPKSQQSNTVMIYTIFNLTNDLFNIIDKAVSRDKLLFESELITLLKENYINSLAEEELDNKATHYRLKNNFKAFISYVKSDIRYKKLESYYVLKAEQFRRYMNYKLRSKVFMEMKNYCFYHKRWMQSINRELKKTTLM